jgi:hypothetical protein
MDQPLKTYALQLWGEYLRLKRTESLDKLQSELGSLLEYAPNAAKQAVSQLEHGRGWIPRNKFKTFVRVLGLDESLFRRLDFHYTAGEYGKMVDLLTDLLKTEFQVTPHQPDELLRPSESTPSPPLPAGDLKTRLIKLKEAFDADLITLGEYDEARKRILEQFVEGA